MIADRLARVRLSAAQLQALVLTGLAIALVSFGIAVASFQRQTGIARQEARYAVTEAQRAGADSLARSCDFVAAFRHSTAESAPTTSYGLRLQRAAEAWLDANQCP